MCKAYVLRAGDTPEMIAAGLVGDAGRAGELIGSNPQFTRVVRRETNGRPVRVFEPSAWIEGAQARLPASWVGSVGSTGQVGLARGEACNGIWPFCDDGLECQDGVCLPPQGTQGAPCHAGSDCNNGLFCNNAVCSTVNPNPGGGGGTGDNEGRACSATSDCGDPNLICRGGVCENPANPGTYNPPSCSSDAIVRKVQAALGVTVDGSWGCKSQDALEKSGLEYRYLAGTCDGQPPNPAKTSGCAAGQKCINGSCGGGGGGPVVTPTCGEDGAGCSTDGDCCAGISCQSGRCTSPVVTPAKSNSMGWILALIAGAAGVVGVAYSSSKKKGGAKQNPAGGMMNKQEAVRDFKKYILPGVIARYGRNDKPAIHEAWNDYTDSLQKDGLITATQYNNWAGPF